MELAFILVALATIAGAIFAIRSAVGVMLSGYIHKIAKVTYSHAEEKEQRRVIENELWILKGYRRFNDQYPQPGMSINTHNIETLETEPVLFMLEGHYNDAHDAQRHIRYQLVEAIARALFNKELIEIQTRDNRDSFYPVAQYYKQMRAIIRVVNPSAKSIEPRVQVPHYGRMDVNPNARINQTPQ